jgi:hypothetical protein
MQGRADHTIVIYLMEERETIAVYIRFMARKSAPTRNCSRLPTPSFPDSAAAVVGRNRADS